MEYKLTDKQRRTISEALVELALRRDRAARKAHKRYPGTSEAIYHGQRRKQAEDVLREVFGATYRIPYSTAGNGFRSLDEELEAEREAA